MVHPARQVTNASVVSANALPIPNSATNNVSRCPPTINIVVLVAKYVPPGHFVRLESVSAAEVPHSVPMVLATTYNRMQHIAERVKQSALPETSATKANVYPARVML